MAKLDTKKALEVKLEKLLNKKNDIESKYFEARQKANQSFNSLGWGAGMRRSKISVSSTREDNLKKRLDAVKEQIREIQELTSLNFQT